MCRRGAGRRRLVLFSALLAPVVLSGALLVGDLTGYGSAVAVGESRSQGKIQGRVQGGRPLAVGGRVVVEPVLMGAPPHQDEVYSGVIVVESVVAAPEVVAEPEVVDGTEEGAAGSSESEKVSSEREGSGPPERE